MGTRRTTVDGDQSKRLGVLLKEERERQGILAAHLARELDWPRSYLAYLEAGRFKEVGLDRFSRIVTTLGLSATNVLHDTGYLPEKPEDLPDPRSYILAKYKLTPTEADQAIAFLEFLQARSPKSSSPSRSKKK